LLGLCRNQDGSTGKANIFDRLSLKSFGVSGLMGESNVCFAGSERKMQKKNSACVIIELDAVLVRKETNAQFNA
jgi:hypothetical protein